MVKLCSILKSDEAIKPINTKEMVMNKSSEKQVKEVNTNPEMCRLDEVLQAISLTDSATVSTLAKETDTELRRSNIASLIISTAHHHDLLKSIRKVSTMRELLYNLLAVKTKKAKEFHREQEAKVSDTISDIKSDATAVLVFSSMYPSQYKKVIG